MRPALPALALAVLLVTAGCAGGVGDSGGPAESPADESADTTTTATDGTQASDASTPDAESGATTAADRLPPGLTADGLADADALASAHADALEARSVTVRERHVRRSADGDLRWRTNLTLRTAANRTRFLTVTETTDRPVFGADEGRAATFADGERVYRSVETPNSTWSDVLRTPSGDPESPANVGLDVARTDDLYVVLNAFALDDAAPSNSASNDSAAVRQSPGDAPHYRLDSATLARAELLASHLNLTEVGNATLSAVVTPEGLVESVRVTYEGTKDGDTVRGTTTLDYSRVGETTVETPMWHEGMVESRKASDEKANDGTSTTQSAD